MDRNAFDALAAAAAATVRDLASAAGRPWRVELRHGPFKPAPAAARELQLHLLLDDETSLAQLPCALLTQRAATGRLLDGETLMGKRADCGSPAVWMQEARRELARWRDALAAREIPFRHWLFDPEPRLAEGRVIAREAWDLWCLLRGAATASDLHYRAAMLAAAQAADEDLARPLLSQLPEVSSWQALAEDWDRVRDQAMPLIERRLERLAGWTNVQ
jgi:hypothetical protein